MRRQFVALSLLFACQTLVASTSADAASVQTISNPVPNGYIKLDGNIADWLAITGYAQDTVGDGSTGAARPLDIDILQGAIAHDENFIYFLYRNAGDNMVDVASNWVFIDLDQNASTGLSSISAMGSIGTDYNLGGTGGWNAWNAAGGHAGAAAGRSVAIGDSNGSGGADFIEWSISRTAVQPGGGTFNPPTGSFNVVFGAEDTTIDTSPNNGNVDWFTYNATGVYNPGVAGDADGNGVVNTNDYLLIQANSFTIVPLGTLGDVNDSGFVDFDDFQQWKTSFPGGVAAAEAAVAALPEPASWGLALSGIGFLFAKRRKRGA
ncbi:PEP-CTERM sorting domain-containing protein [Lacipirellula sp.]|uniref:PEP-CTERM sorting domain-containing protein n=1 Tax=Lacipirellula sp. TaxID=2691419 RepID=UPI003D10466D